MPKHDPPGKRRFTVLFTLDQWARIEAARDRLRAAGRTDASCGGVLRRLTDTLRPPPEPAHDPTDDR